MRIECRTMPDPSTSVLVSSISLPDSLDPRPSYNPVSPSSSLPFAVAHAFEDLFETFEPHERCNAFSTTVDDNPPLLVCFSPRHGTTGQPLAIRRIIIISKARKSISREFSLFSFLFERERERERFFLLGRPVNRDSSAAVTREPIIFLLFVSLSALWDNRESIGEPCGARIRGSNPSFYSRAKESSCFRCSSVSRDRDVEK